MRTARAGEQSASLTNVTENWRNLYQNSSGSGIMFLLRHYLKLMEYVTGWLAPSHCHSVNKFKL
jgi:hypothetical protein